MSENLASFQGPTYGQLRLSKSSARYVQAISEAPLSQPSMCLSTQVPEHNPINWLRDLCTAYRFNARGVLLAGLPDTRWPLTADGPESLRAELEARNLLLPLPKEPAALANVVEVGIVDYVIEAAALAGDITVTRGTERGYPDLELTGPRFDGEHYAVDVKVAQRARTRDRLRTQSRITLYTGNTYFRWPNLKWPGTFRPFNDYVGHLDILVLYTLDEQRRERVTDLEVLVQQPWQIGSRKRSSTTREYIGAVDLIESLRGGHGEFETEAEFYKYWRAYSFRISEGVQRQLRTLMDAQRVELEHLRATRATVTEG